MRRAPRFFSSRLTSTERRVYRGATLWFVVAALAMLWPLYVPAARPLPLVFGMPFALFWLFLLLVASFGVGVGLYRWELGRGALDAATAVDEDAEPERGGSGSAAEPD